MNRKYFIYLLIFYIILILIGSTLPGNLFPSGKIFDFDKIIHIMEYIILAFLFLNAIKSPNISNVLLIIVIGTAYGVFNEFWQLFVSDRYASFWDGLANTVGMIIGSVITYKYLIISNDK